MKAALYTGSIRHERFTPKEHGFKYPFFMWFLNLSQLDQIEDRGIWFSTKRWALSRFYRPDYLGDASTSLQEAVAKRMEELTGKEVGGEIFGLLNLRTCGLYFSPVNFYFGYDTDGNFTHFLAEVSNIPWNGRHQYGYYVADGIYAFEGDKQFHVSPFNPDSQRYSWEINPPGEKLMISLAVSDERGKIFTAELDLQRKELERKKARAIHLRKPVMTAWIVAGIYYQALKLYLKGVPYVPYRKETL